ncbi:transporter [Acinetobacter shaoyimingii]|uniref:Transporter n=1 Tax=Acinetobacter shaoyimingii TaxID=2715164 RepID=A0A6G8RRU7_9GAMM|nr:transporter [Acinetobacter shaoyimingii]NHB56895.1 transporter [Acinetobacter shaoyimingii]QIO04597.1 transporter [Acinetobacter shaoyimingii]
MTILKKTTLVFAVTASMHSMYSMAADFEFDRPGDGFSTTTTPVGRLAWEQALPTAQYQEFRTLTGDKGNQTSLKADMLLRTGLMDGLELRLGWDGPAWSKTRFQGQHFEDDGLGDVTIGLKKSIDLKDDKLTMAVLAQALIATGNDGFTAHDDIYMLASSVNYKYSEGLTTGITMKYEVQNSDWAVTAVPTLGYKIAGPLSGYSQLVYRKAESQDYEYGLGSGLIYALSDRAQLDASIGVDLQGSNKSYNGGLGISYLF